jgi:hypothetical protein
MLGKLTLLVQSAKGVEIPAPPCITGRGLTSTVDTRWMTKMTTTMMTTGEGEVEREVYVEGEGEEVCLAVLFESNCSNFIT